MKKLLTVALAATMAIGLVSVSFASSLTMGSVTTQVISDRGVDTIGSNAYAADDDGLVDLDQPVSILTAGEAIYFPLYTVAGDLVTMSDAVKSVSISTKYSLGQTLSGGVKIVQKKYTQGGATAYAYFLELSAKSYSGTSTQDIAVDVTLRKTSGSDSNGDSYAFNMVVSIATPVGYGITTDTIYEDVHILDVTDESGVYTFYFDVADGCYFEVDVTGQGKIQVGFDTKFNSAVANLYPQANMDFYNGNGASFNKTGTLFLQSDSYTYLYAVHADYTLSEVSNAYYDTYEGGWLITTRTLGTYVLSDVELDIAADATEVDDTGETDDGDPADDTAGDGSEDTAGSASTEDMSSSYKPNPGTGAHI